jgi:large subunit ribosomal protein L19
MILQRLASLSIRTPSPPVVWRTPSAAAGVASTHQQLTSIISGRVNFSTDSEAALTDDMPYLHHGHRPRFRGYQKFKSPRKRASKLFEELNKEACEKAKESNPVIWQNTIRVGDSVELKMVSQGGLKETEKQEVEKIRGVVLGIVKRGLGSSMILRDVVYGLPIERRVPLYSPMIKDCTILEKNFIFKGKKKIKRSKLYYFRDRNPLLTKVSKY